MRNEYKIIKTNQNWWQNRAWSTRGEEETSLVLNPNIVLDLIVLDVVLDWLLDYSRNAKTPA